MGEVEEELSVDEIIFIEAFLHNGNNATEAYKVISPTSSESNAKSQGSRWLKKCKSTQLFAEKLHEIRNNYGITMKMQIERLNSIYERSMEHKMKLEFDPVDKKMVPKVDDDGNMLFEYDSRGALGAIKEQNEMLGFHKAQRLKLEGNGANGAIEVTHRQLTKSQETAISLVDDLAKEEDALQN